MLKKRVLHNGGTNLHIIQDAQGCQDGIKRTLNTDLSLISQQQKNVVWTVNPGYPRNLDFTSGLYHSITGNHVKFMRAF